MFKQIIRERGQREKNLEKVLKKYEKGQKEKVVDNFERKPGVYIDRLFSIELTKKNNNFFFNFNFII